MRGFYYVLREKSPKTEGFHRPANAAVVAQERL